MMPSIGVFKHLIVNKKNGKYIRIKALHTFRVRKQQIKISMIFAFISYELKKKINLFDSPRTLFNGTKDNVSRHIRVTMMR
jgi:hypothetical protein